MTVQLGNAYGEIVIGTGEAENNIGGLGARMRGVQDQFSQVGANMRRTGTMMSLAVTTPIVGLGVAMTNMASDLREANNKVGVVFDQQAATIQAWSTDSAAAFGMAQEQALEAVGTFGNLFDSMGTPEQATADMSRALVELAADLASFNNITVDETLIKLRAGMVGEVEPLRTLGVNVSAAAVELKALEMGLISSGEKMTDQQKLTARYALIMEQTANAQGDFERTSGDLANMQRIVRAEFVNLGATLGRTLLPFALKIAQALRAVMAQFKALSPQMQRMVVIFGAVAAAAGPLLVVLGTLVTAIGALLSPIGLVLAGVIALGALWASNFGGIRDKTMAVVEAVRPYFETLVEWMKAAAGGDFEPLKQGVKDAFANVKTQITAFDWGEFGQGIKDAIDKVDFATLRQNIVASLGLDKIDWATTGENLLGTFDVVKTAVVDAIKAIDWTTLGENLLGAFDAVKTAVVDTIKLIDWTTLGESLLGAFDAVKDGVVTAVTGIDWSTMAENLGTAFNTLRDNLLASMTTFVAGIDWTAAITGLITSLTNGIATTDWTIVGTIAANMLKAAVALAFAGAIAAVKSIQWVMNSDNFSGLATAIKDAVAEIDWDVVKDALDELLTSATAAWDEFTTALFAGLPEFSWSSFIPNTLSWRTFVPNDLGWRTFIPADVTWSTFVPSIKWSSFIPSFNWSQFFSKGDGDSGGGNPLANLLPGGATGGLITRGGRILVGEEGPEVVDLPTGSRVYDSQTSMQMAGASGINVTVNVASIDSHLDIAMLAHQVAAKIDRSMRR